MSDPRSPPETPQLTGLLDVCPLGSSRVKRHVVVMVGAGASAHSAPSGCPPLGDHLFEALFAEGGAAARVPAEIQGIFREKGGFERGMARIRTMGNLRLDLARQMGAYFARFRLSPDSLYRRLVEMVGGHCTQLAYISLNYDTLLDKSLEGWPTYWGPNTEWDPRAVAVLKPHGSCNLLPSLEGDRFPRGNRYNNSVPQPWEAEPRIEIDLDEVIRWCQDPAHGSIAPILSEYAEGKQALVSDSWIAEVQRTVASYLSEAEYVCVIGVAYAPQDTHLWEPLLRSKGTVAFVNPESEGADWLERENTACKVVRLARFFETGVLPTIADALSAAVDESIERHRPR